MGTLLTVGLIVVGTTDGVAVGVADVGLTVVGTRVGTIVGLIVVGTSVGEVVDDTVETLSSQTIKIMNFLRYLKFVLEGFDIE